MIPFINLANPLPTTPGTGLTEGQEAALTTATRRQPVASIAALKALTPSAGDAVNVLGYAAAGDGGGGTFYYDAAASAADNGGTIIAPTAGAGRWKRVYSGAVSVKGFGAKGDGATDDSAALTAAIAAAKHVHFPSGTYRGATIALVSGTKITGTPTSLLKLNDGVASGTDLFHLQSVSDVSISDIAIDGNRGALGFSNVSMSGINVVGACDNVTIDNVTCLNMCGDGVYLSFYGDIANYPTNVCISGCKFTNSGRQDIALVVCKGITVTGCTGDGRLDIENGDALATCEQISVSACNFARISVIPDAGASTKTCNISISGCTVTDTFFSWHAKGLVVSGVSVLGTVELSEIVDSVVSDIKCSKLYVRAPNAGYSTGCIFSNIRIVSAVDNAYGLHLFNVKDCEFDDIFITMTGATSIAVYVEAHSSAVLSGSSARMRNVRGSATQYGLRVNNTAPFLGSELVLESVHITGAPSRILSSGTTGYGSFRMHGCSSAGELRIQNFEKISVRDLCITGDSGVQLNSSTNAYVNVDGLTFERATSGTSALQVSTHTTLKGVSISRIKHMAPGTLGASAVTFASSTFDTGVKAFFNDIYATSTSWLASLADASILEGSMYRLLGNTTNYAYTHNGTAWVPRAH